MEKSFPNTKQKVGSHYCGPMCLKNTYDYLGIQKTLKQIFKEMDVDEDTSTYLSQLARNLNANNVATTIVSSLSKVINYAWRNNTKEEIISKLKRCVLRSKRPNMISEWDKELLHTLFYLQEGGNIKIENITKEIINSYLKKGKIIITCVETSWFWGNRKILGKTTFDDVLGDQSGHFVIITGIKNDKYIINYPYPLKEKNAVTEINQDHLIVATLIWDAQFIII
ncbi:hypothetical protein KBD45_03165 [Candidatus Dojkabacteria bacterium]|nr:hypothetical protein [Candidatus Dojkabacteria bacterium]